jgi:hypothetical protein
MSGYLKFDSSDGAEQRSMELWEQRLGRPPHPDATTHLYISSKTATESYLVVSDDGDLLTNDEKAALDSEAVYNAWDEANFPSDE